MFHTLSYFHAFVYLFPLLETQHIFSTLYLGRLLYMFWDSINSNLLWEVFHVGIKNTRQLCKVLFARVNLSSSLKFSSLGSPDFLLIFLFLLDRLWCPSLSGSLTSLSLEHLIYLHKTVLIFNNTLLLRIYCLLPPTPTR